MASFELILLSHFKFTFFSLEHNQEPSGKETVQT